MRPRYAVVTDIYGTLMNQCMVLEGCWQVGRIRSTGQRRNIWVHNRGVTNRLYTANVCHRLIETCGIAEGKAVEIEADYLVGAIDAVYLCGMILRQQSRRKWNKDETARAALELSKLT